MFSCRGIQRRAHAGVLGVEVDVLGMREVDGAVAAKGDGDGGGECEEGDESAEQEGAEHERVARSV